MSSFNKIVLSSGRSLPTIGFGTYAPLRGEEEVIHAVKVAVQAGYRHIDCAAIYRNERAVGRALKELFIMGVVQRKDLCITSKLWNTCHKPELVYPSLKKTLEDLDLDYIDLYLMHWPMAYKEGGEFNPVDENGKTLYSDVDFVETWKAMEDCKDMGKTLDLGLCNFNSKQIERLLALARFKPVTLQVEINCHNTNTKLIEFAKKMGLAVVAFSPLGTPHKNPNTVKLLEEKEVQEIAKSKGKTPAQILLRFLIQQQIIVIPKSVNQERIEENIKIFDFSLTDGEMEHLFALNKNHRKYKEQIALEHKYYPFNEEF